MKHFELNLLPSGFVPSLPRNESEAPKLITTVNGHSIESLESTAAFNRMSGCELDRLCNASKELRSILGSDTVTRAREFAKTLKKR